MKTHNMVPIADLIPDDETQGLTPNPEGPFNPPLSPQLPQLPTTPFPVPTQLCFIDLKAGCYKIKYTPASPLILTPYYLGTIRVENTGGGKRISGDLYKFSNILPFPFPVVVQGNDAAADAPTAIPIYSRTKYYSYLKGTGFAKSSVFSATCQMTITLDEYVYNKPVAPSFNGTFNNAKSRTIKIIVKKGVDANTFTGNLYEGAVNKGAVTLEWVSEYYRRAVVEIDTLVGSVPPVPVNPGTAAEESFKTIFKTVGWEMTPIYNDLNVAVPAGVTPTNCWPDATLHALMAVVKSPAASLDAEWRYHMMVVPGNLGCSRGKMYDSIGAHREGVVSYSDDGYPTGHSSNFGTAANKKQRNVPRAYIRSAAHELGHACNMIHQEGEGGADNSIMTTTPSVADVLGGPASGAAGVFPDHIHLGFNEHCRQHLIHFPDVVVRPGGLNFGAGHNTFAPQASDYEVLDARHVSFVVKAQSDRIKIGEPLLLAWEATNNSGQEINIPSDISHITELVNISVIDPDGNETEIPSFVIECEHISIKPLPDKKKLAAATNLFWGSKGFAFTKPGKHIVNIFIGWNDKGVHTALSASKEVWVDYPVTEKDNEVASLMMNDEVGMFVALGGQAYHLTEASKRIAKVIDIDAGHAVAKAMNKLYSSNSAQAYIPIEKKMVKK
ncbi:hypothetical protein [Dyadobacter psychrotolerans]|uniref:Uncharacterized protein n=1 Tax=Dyadobacter psychrotolerans TaxID=2541721 RepID=A0A4R5DXF7_9BACT|nr:hypothetical protein [Dyadobacter psychrotolerans]TDE17344.1 hypothetical protein E0F88_05495 [Dyadobacter psychrotolerans]